MRQQVDFFLEQLHQRTDLTLESKIEKILKFGCETFGLELGIMSKIIDEQYTVLNCYPASETGVKPTQTFPLHITYCNLVCVNQSIIGFTDVRNSEWSSHPCYREFKLKAYFGAPLIINNRIFGTLNFSSTSAIPDESLASIKEGVEILNKYVNKQLASQPEAKKLCQHLCNNFTTICSAPLIHCLEQDTTDNQGLPCQQQVNLECSRK